MVEWKRCFKTRWKSCSTTICDERCGSLLVSICAVSCVAFNPKSGGGLAHSKTLACVRMRPANAKRLGVRQSSGAFALTLLVIFLGLFLWLPVSAQTDPSSKQRQRRIIFNNDGNEPVYLCKTASKEELLRSRTTPLIGTQVDSIFYCT